MTKTLIYTRVSSTQQSAEDKVSLDQQTEACFAYADSRSYEVVDVVREVKSAGTIRERPLLLDAMRRIKDGEADVLLAYCLDRLTRQQIRHLHHRRDDSSSRSYRVRYGGVRGYSHRTLHPLRESIRGRGGIGEDRHSFRYGATGASVQWALAGQRQFSVSATVTRARRRADTKSTRLQAPVVKRIFADFVSGKSIARIVAELNDEDIPTNTGAGRWHKPTVWNLLRCRAYLGEAVMMRTQYGDDGKSRVLRPESEEMVYLPEGTIPPLIERTDLQPGASAIGSGIRPNSCGPLI